MGAAGLDPPGRQPPRPGLRRQPAPGGRRARRHLGIPTPTGRCPLVLENAAGHGRHRRPHLRRAGRHPRRSGPHPRGTRLKVCLDTQHLWASGVDFGDVERGRRRRGPLRRHYRTGLVSSACTSTTPRSSWGRTGTATRTSGRAPSAPRDSGPCSPIRPWSPCRPSSRSPDSVATGPRPRTSPWPARPSTRESPSAARPKLIRRDRDTCGKRQHGGDRRPLRPLLGRPDTALAASLRHQHRDDAQAPDPGLRPPQGLPPPR